MGEKYIKKAYRRGPAQEAVLDRTGLQAVGLTAEADEGASQVLARLTLGNLKGTASRDNFAIELQICSLTFPPHSLHLLKERKNMLQKTFYGKKAYDRQKRIFCLLCFHNSFT